MYQVDHRVVSLVYKFVTIKTTKPTYYEIISLQLSSVKSITAKPSQAWPDPCNKIILLQARVRPRHQTHIVTYMYIHTYTIITICESSVSSCMHANHSLFVTESLIYNQLSMTVFMMLMSDDTIQ